MTNMVLHSIKSKLLIFILPLVSFFLALFTISDYGVNWDTYQHLVRGNIYLRYILTGQRNSQDIPAVCTKSPDSISGSGDGRECPIIQTPRISFFEKSSLDMGWADKLTIGHPPLMDIVMAISNRILYKSLGIFEDVASYNVVPVFFTFLLTIVVVWWAFEVGGVLTAFLSSLAIIVYPLLIAEQHFNIKDPIITSLITITAYCIYKAVTTGKKGFLYMGSLPFALALGTKFNIIFLPINLIPWLIVATTKFHPSIKKQWKSWIISLGIILAFSYLVFYLSFPSIWGKPIEGLLSVIQYYQSISKVGGEPCPYIIGTGKWFLCSSYQPFLLFFTTIPSSILLLGLTGSVLVFKKFTYKSGVYLLWLSLCYAPLIRATLPIMSLYGGSLRQIMEFYPFFALLVGVGGSFVLHNLSKRFYKVISVFLIISFFLTIQTLVKMHPYENIYFNEFVGGVRGAKQLGLPLVGNTYGSAYRSLLRWLNGNAPDSSSFATLVSIGSSFPALYIRPDIKYLADSNDITKHSGEYLLEITTPGMNIEDRFRYRYASKLLKPVYELKYDDVSLGTIWRNLPTSLYDWAKSSQYINVLKTHLTSTSIDLVLPSQYLLEELTMNTNNEQCLYALTTGTVLAKSSINSEWTRFSEGIAFFNPFVANLSKQRKFVFAADTVSTLRIVVVPNLCDLSTIDYQLSVFGSGGGDSLTILGQPGYFSQ